MDLIKATHASMKFANQIFGKFLGGKKMTVSNESFRWGIFCLSWLLVLEEKNLPSLYLWMSAEKRLHIGHWDSNLGCQLDPSGKGELRCGAASIGLACWKPVVCAAVV